MPVLIFKLLFLFEGNIDSYGLKDLKQLQNYRYFINPLNVNPKKWSNTLKQFGFCRQLFECVWSFCEVGAEMVKNEFNRDFFSWFEEIYIRLVHIY